MGLAASQARLLTITARLADNELRSQTINNAKMRLATQSSQASEDYVAALNNAQLMFKNTDVNGNMQNQILNFNNLTSYSPYNTQYGLVNSAGLALVSEEEDALFKSSGGDLNKYLESHGLSWETTFFGDENDSTIATQLTSFYSEEGNDALNYLFTNKKNKDYKALYEQYMSNELSIEKQDFANRAMDYYNQLKGLSSLVQQELRKQVLGTTYASVDAYISTITSQDTTSIPGTLSRIVTNETIKNFLTDTAYSDLTKYVNNKPRKVDDSTYVSATKSVEVTSTTTSGETIYNIDDIKITCATGTTSYTIEFAADSGTWVYGTTNPTTTLNTSEDPTTTKTWSTTNTVGITDVIKNIQHIDSTSKTTKYTGIDTGNGYATYKVQGKRDDIVQPYVEEFFSLLLDYPTNLNVINYANNNIGSFPEFEAAYKAFYNMYGIDIGSDYNLLFDFEELLKSDKSHYTTSTATTDYPAGSLKGTDAFKNVVNAMIVDLMVDVLGAPKYSWIDSTDTTNSGNPEAKAQWYTNLFNRMKQGYKVLEDGLASSSKWLEYAFESGLVSMEQVDTAFNWNALTYSSCSSIYEDSESSEAVAKAEAQYKRAMNDIETKDSMYDIQLKNIDTEHNALQTEYESVKKVIEKNIERTMKFDQSG